jgi:hypothetical protein
MNGEPAPGIALTRTKVEVVRTITCAGKLLVLLPLASMPPAPRPTLRSTPAEIERPAEAERPRLTSGLFRGLGLLGKTVVVRSGRAC